MILKKFEPFCFNQVMLSHKANKKQYYLKGDKRLFNSLSQPIIAYFSLFQHSLANQGYFSYASLLQPISANSSRLQSITVYYSLLQPITT